MAWEALNNIAGGRPPGRHRRQRQRALLRADHRRARRPPRLAAADAGVRAGARDRAKPRWRAPRSSGRRSTTRCTASSAASRTPSPPQGMFEDLGLKYVGPIDGHDTAALESALRRARGFGGPVIVHAVTRKGFGYGRPRPTTPTACTASRVIDPVTGKPLSEAAAGWTQVFSDEMVQIAGRRPDVVGITAAMLQPGRAARDVVPLPGPGLRRRHRRAARRRPPPRGWPWAACSRSSRSTPRSSTGRSTRC